jgi:hypothetical protein
LEKPYIYVPNALINIVAARTTTYFSSVTANLFIPSVAFKVPNAAREEASSDKI